MTPCAIRAGGLFVDVQPSLFSAVDSRLYSGPWPKAGLMRSGDCFALPMWAPRTGGSDSSFWPTATESDSASSGRHSTTTGVMHPGTSLTEDGESCGNHPSAKGGDSLTGQTRMWPTPQAQDGDERNSIPSQMKHAEQGHQPSLHAEAGRWMWPTPAATPYGSSQNGINGKGGEHERPSANTPSLERMSRSFLPDLLISSDGDESSPSDQISPQLWKTPHGMVNTDVKGHTGGAGGKFAKQALKFDRDRWSTPRLGPNTTSRRAMTERPDGGGGTSALSLAQQATGEVLISQSRAKLNPRFTEWLMGLPIGWTSASTAYGLAAMEWSRWRSQSRSALLRLAPLRSDDRRR